MLKYILRLFKEISGKIKVESSSQYRIVKQSYYDEVLLEVVDIYNLEKKQGLNWCNVTDTTFRTYQEALNYYHKLLEYIKKTEITYEYLDNTKPQIKH
jgi:hypothetical protein